MPINDDVALSITTVYACIRLLVDSVSTLELNALKRTSDKSTRPVLPVPPVVDRPSPEMSRRQFIAQMMFSLLLRGNFFGLVTARDDRGLPVSVLPVHPDMVNVWRGSDGLRHWRINGKPVDGSDVVHVPSGMVPPGGFLGLNPVEYARSSWAISAAAERYGGNFFANSANPSGVISVDEDLSPEQTLRMKRDWMQYHQGVGNAQYPAVLTAGAKWTAMSLTMDDAQFLQTRAFQDTQIMAWFGIPPHMLGAVDRTTSWGTGIEQQEIGFAINTLMAWTTRIEDVFSAMLPKNQVARFDLSSRLRGDTLQRFQAYTMARGGGWMSVNEIRDREDMPPISDGDNYLQPMNMAPLGYDPTKNPDGSKPPAGTNDSGLDSGGGAGTPPVGAKS